MKIQHWAIIFIIIILPISIICRNVISKKNWLLRDETRYNNIIDNATYDAVAQIVEVSEELEYGKNIPMTYGVANAAIDRFFNTLSVNFNMPIGREKAEAYFCQYIPAIVIVGYDGLFVYSYEETEKGYDFTLKPKIPYAYTYRIPNSRKSVTVNFTLDNYVTLYFSDDEFLVGAPDANGIPDDGGTHVLEGYVGEFLDVDQNGIDDLKDFYDTETGLLIAVPEDKEQYVDNDDPYGLNVYQDNVERRKYILNTLPMYTDNISYILKQLFESGRIDSSNPARGLDIFYEDGAKQDYVYDDDGNTIIEASDFNTLRRETIIGLITSVLKEEFNQHNDYADSLGVTYNFNLPEIGRDQWNNTIDDISVLAFFQGMPMGADYYYNNYSLGGARIVKANYLYAETVKGWDGEDHKVYHKFYCPLIPRDTNDNFKYSTGESKFENGTFPNGTARMTTGVEQIFINSNHAKKAGYSVCSECM